MYSITKFSFLTSRSIKGVLIAVITRLEPGTTQSMFGHDATTNDALSPPKMWKCTNLPEKRLLLTQNLRIGIKVFFKSHFLFFPL